MIISDTIARSAVKLQKYYISCLDITNDLNTFLMTKNMLRAKGKYLFLIVLTFSHDTQVPFLIGMMSTRRPDSATQ